QVSLGNLGERFVRRSEDRERALALQGVHQAGLFEGDSQRLETAGGNSGVDDVLGLNGGGAGHAGGDDKKFFHGTDLSMGRVEMDNNWTKRFQGFHVLSWTTTIATAA